MALPKVSPSSYFLACLSHCQNQRHKINSKHSAFLFLSLSLSKNNRSFRDEAVKKNKKKCLQRAAAAHATQATVAFYLHLIHLALCLLLQVSISPTFYEQLLCSQIPKAQKKLLNLTVFIALLGSVRVKAARRTLVKLTPGINFTNIL
jgi:hypothetical protein